MNNYVLLILTDDYWQLAADVLGVFSETPPMLTGLPAEARHPGFVAIVPTIVGGVQFRGIVEVPVSAVVLIASNESGSTGFHAILQARQKGKG